MQSGPDTAPSACRTKTLKFFDSKTRPGTMKIDSNLKEVETKIDIEK